MLSLRYIETREWKDLHEAYEMLWGHKFAAGTQCVFSCWKHVLWASIETRYRWGVTKAMAQLKTTWLADPGATGLEVPPVQPISTVGWNSDCSNVGCKGRSATAKECPLPVKATKVKRERHTDPIVQPLEYYCGTELVQVAESEQLPLIDATNLDQAAEAAIDWNLEVTENECEEFFLSMFTTTATYGADGGEGGAAAECTPTSTCTTDVVGIDGANPVRVAVDGASGETGAISDGDETDGEQIDGDAPTITDGVGGVFSTLQTEDKIRVWWPNE